MDLKRRRSALLHNQFSVLTLKNAETIKQPGHETNITCCLRAYFLSFFLFLYHPSPCAERWRWKWRCSERAMETRTKAKKISKPLEKLEGRTREKWEENTFKFLFSFQLTRKFFKKKQKERKKKEIYKSWSGSALSLASLKAPEETIRSWLWGAGSVGGLVLSVFGKGVWRLDFIALRAVLHGP